MTGSFYIYKVNKMGIKKMFKKKEPTEQELRDDLNRVGITTKSGNSRPEKFGAFKQYAQQRSAAQPGLAPVNPYANIGNTNGNSQGNPYAQNGDAPAGNPYGSNGDSGNGASNPYASNKGNQASPYSQETQGTGQQNQRANPYGAQENGNRHAPPKHDPYGRQTSRAQEFDNESLDLNHIPTNQMYASKKPARRPVRAAQTSRDDETLDLNELPPDEYDDLNLNIDEDIPEEDQVNSEDEEVEAIKQDIRFVKQESLALTRNTLRMAQEADSSGTNTLGMLGSQSERIYHAEQNLLLADTQTQIADAKVKELKRLNRSIFVPAYGNPFNRKSRLRQQEENIKVAKTQEKYMRESHRQDMYASEQRIKQGITNNATNSDTHQKYRGEKDLAAAQRYQFENDSEDDEVEKELAGNLDQIGIFAKKLKGTATTMGKEVESQNTRLKQIEDDADRLDINVHMNNTRLSNIR